MILDDMSVHTWIITMSELRYGTFKHDSGVETHVDRLDLFEELFNLNTTDACLKFESIICRRVFPNYNIDF